MLSPVWGAQLSADTLCGGTVAEDRTCTYNRAINAERLKLPGDNIGRCRRIAVWRRVQNPSTGWRRPGDRRRVRRHRTNGGRSIRLRHDLNRCRLGIDIDRGGRRAVNCRGRCSRNYGGSVIARRGTVDISRLRVNHRRVSVAIGRVRGGRVSSVKSIAGPAKPDPKAEIWPAPAIAAMTVIPAIITVAVIAVTAIPAATVPSATITMPSRIRGHLCKSRHQTNNQN